MVRLLLILPQPSDDCYSGIFRFDSFPRVYEKQGFDESAACASMIERAKREIDNALYILGKTDIVIKIVRAISSSEIEKGNYKTLGVVSAIFETIPNGSKATKEIIDYTQKTKTTEVTTIQTITETIE